MTKYDLSAIEYIYDKYNKEYLFTLEDTELKILVFQECDKLSWANEELEYGTYGKYYYTDVNSIVVYNYIIKERDGVNEINSKRKTSL